MLTNIHRNTMGTVSFYGKFDGMRKAQDFIVYPMKDQSAAASIQSDNRFGKIDMATGTVVLSKPANYANSMTLAMTGKIAGTLSAEELLMLKAHIFGSAHGHAGTNGVVYVDNSAAVDVFAA